MTKAVLITGLAGAGKSTLSKQLRDMGYSSYDIETLPGLFKTIYKDTKEPFPDYDDQNPEHVKKAGWVCDEDRLREIIASEHEPLSFYCGMSSNIQDLLGCFSVVFVLSASPGVTRERLTNRTSHNYGKTKDVQDWLLSWKSDWEKYMQDRGAVIINSDQNVGEIAKEVVSMVSNP